MPLLNYHPGRPDFVHTLYMLVYTQLRSGKSGLIECICSRTSKPKVSEEGERERIQLLRGGGGRQYKCKSGGDSGGQNTVVRLVGWGGGWGGGRQNKVARVVGEGGGGSRI